MSVLITNGTYSTGILIISVVKLVERMWRISYINSLSLHMKYWRVGVKIATPGTQADFITDIMAVAITNDNWHEGHIQREIESYADVREYHGAERSDVSILERYNCVRYDFVAIERDKTIDSILT